MSLEDNLAALRARVAAACDRADRDPAFVELLAVSKKIPAPTIREAADLGLTLFGENRVQEAKQKMPDCPGHLTWHLIGHLQTNKCRDAVRQFDMIQGVDTARLAEELNACADKQAKTVPILLEINIGGETSKYGLPPKDAVDAALAINDFPRLEIHGLMAMAPWSPHAERSRPYFREMAALKKRVEDALGAPLPVLSLGMSGDFEVAIEEGSTMIRVGTALFGPSSRQEQ